MADGKTVKKLLIEIARLKFENRVTLVALEAGTPVGALPDVVARTLSAFDCGGLKEGEVVALGEHLSPRAFIAALKSNPSAAFLFESTDDAKASSGAKSPTPQPDTRRRREMSLDQQAGYIGRYGGEKYLKLPE